MPPKGATKAKAKAKPRRSEEQVDKRRVNRDHENQMQRMRYHLKIEKPQLKAKLKKASHAVKREWLAKWRKYGNFEFLESTKKESERHGNRKERDYEFMNIDQLFAAHGGTDANRHLPSGIRAQMRVDATVKSCKAIRGMTQVDEQTGDMLFAKLKHKKVDWEDHEQELATVASTERERAPAPAEGQLVKQESSSSYYSSSDNDSDSDENEDEQKQGASMQSGSSNDGLSQVDPAVCQKLGDCSTLLAILDSWAKGDMPYLAPWNSQIAESVEKLEAARDTYTNAVARSTKEGVPEADAGLAEAKSLYEIIIPVMRSVQAAQTASSKKFAKK